MNDAFNKLCELFRKFPGIGPRQAKRFAFFLLTAEQSYCAELARRIEEMRREMAHCSRCFRFFEKRGVRRECGICADPERENGMLMVVATDTDLAAIENSGVFTGRYFVLGGTIPLVSAPAAGRVRLKELLALISAENKKKGLTEIILALSANTEGEYTADELRRQIAPLLVLPAQAGDSPIKISMLGRGLSTGSELEYADKETIKSALKNRASTNT